MNVGSGLIWSSSLVHAHRPRFQWQKSLSRPSFPLSAPRNPLPELTFRVAVTSAREGSADDAQPPRPLLDITEDLRLCRPASGQCCTGDSSEETVFADLQLRRPTPLQSAKPVQQPDTGSPEAVIEELQLRRPAAFPQPREDLSRPRQRAAYWRHYRPELASDPTLAFIYDRGGWPADGQRRGMLEAEVGIRCWTDSLPGFTGILKQR